MVSTLTQIAKQYCESRGIRPTPIYSANRFARLVGNLDPQRITLEHLAKFRRAMEAGGLSAWTVKGAVKDIRTLCTASGNPLHPPPVSVPDPEPEPTPLADVDSIWPHLAQWSRQWIVIALWTGLRLHDSIALQIGGCVLQWTASKTAKRFRWPRLDWIEQHLRPVPLPYVAANDHAATIVRAELDRVSAKAGVPRVMPRHIRQRAITEWTKTGEAGAIIHGCGFIGNHSVMRHYVDKLAILESAAPRVRLPSCFGATPPTAEDSMLSAFRRLDPAAQQLISATAERLAAG